MEQNTELNSKCKCGKCDECMSNNKCTAKHKGISCGSGCSGAIYCLAFVGAVIYYIQQATGFWMGVLGVLKALVWPAMIAYKLLGFLGM
jgi:hypothetical protein